MHQSRSHNRVSRNGVFPGFRVSGLGFGEGPPLIPKLSVLFSRLNSQGSQIAGNPVKRFRVKRFGFSV